MPSAHSLLSALHPGGASKQGALVSPHDKQIRKQSQRLVSQTFFGTLLKQMHNSPFKSKLFSGGRGGEAFSSVLDQHLADRMAAGSGNKLSNAIFHRLKRLESAKSGQAQPNQLNLQSVLKASGARKPPATDWRPHVSTDLRA